MRWGWVSPRSQLTTSLYLLLSGFSLAQNDENQKECCICDWMPTTSLSLEPPTITPNTINDRLVLGRNGKMFARILSKTSNTTIEVYKISTTSESLCQSSEGSPDNGTKLGQTLHLACTASSVSLVMVEGVRSRQGIVSNPTRSPNSFALVAVGCPAEPPETRTIFMFEYHCSTSVWVPLQLGAEFFDDILAGDGFGSALAVSADGRVLAVGAPGSGSKHSVSGDMGKRGGGYVRTYKRVESGGRAWWSQMGDTIWGTELGSQIANSGNGSTLAIVKANGAVSVFRWVAPDAKWTKVHTKSGTHVSGDSMFGNHSICVSDDASFIATGSVNMEESKITLTGYIFKSDASHWRQLGTPIDLYSDFILPRSNSISCTYNPTVGAHIGLGQGGKAGSIRVYNYEQSGKVWKVSFEKHYAQQGIGSNASSLVALALQNNQKDIRVLFGGLGTQRVESVTTLCDCKICTEASSRKGVIVMEFVIPLTIGTVFLSSLIFISVWQCNDLLKRRAPSYNQLNQHSLISVGSVLVEEMDLTEDAQDGV